MKITAITVCVDYADFLAVTLPYTLAHVDQLVVVTSLSDRRTKHLCEGRVRWVQTSAMYDHGRRFSLGAAIDAGLCKIKLAFEPEDWVLVLDADIVLLNHRPLNSLELDRMKLYGIDRFHCRGFDAWQKFKSKRRAMSTCAVPTPDDLPLGYRIAVRELSGYVPCGFFQLWNPISSGALDYPIDPQGTSEGSDMLHAAWWPRSRRELIPEIFGVELSTDKPDDVGLNWSGRRTPEFSAEGGPYKRV